MPELPLVGTEFAGYRLRAVLGRGGMSIVYQAENPRLRNLIALKVLAPELASDQVFRTRFREESQIAASLNHPHVIPIHDFGSSDGLLYIAMRYVSGTDLRNLIADRGWLTPTAAVLLLEQAARALDAAHRRGLVHRDVKPGNLLISHGTDDGDPDHVYLADFGITKYVGGRTGLTVAGTVLGTVHYASPEQIQEATVLGTADQYSLGCVLYECLTGQAPFERSSSEAIMWGHVHELAAPPSQLRPGLPPAVDDVFARVLAKHPGDRYTGCREFIAAARHALAQEHTGPQDRCPPDTGARDGGARDVGARDVGARDVGARDVGARDIGAREGGARDIGSRDIGARGEFRPAPVPSGGLRDLGRAPHAPPPEPPTGIPLARASGPGMTAGASAPGVAAGMPGPGAAAGASAPGPVTGMPGPGAAAGAADSGAGRRPSFPGGRTPSGGSRRAMHARRPEARSVRTVLGLVAVAIVAAGGTAAGLLVSHAGAGPTATPLLAHSPSLPASARPAPASELFSVLGRAEQFTGMLKLSACAQTTTALVQCTDPDPAIASVTFATYPSLDTLYTKYQEIVDNLARKSFGSVENLHVCGSLAPDPTAENTWNHSDQYSTKYSVTQLASGTVSADAAMGRVFCEQTQTGSEYIVWTQDSGRLLGYATGTASHEQVWNWFVAVHHNITFPGQPAMTGK